LWDENGGGGTGEGDVNEKQAERSESLRTSREMTSYAFTVLVEVAEQ